MEKETVTLDMPGFHALVVAEFQPKILVLVGYGTSKPVGFFFGGWEPLRRCVCNNTHSAISATCPQIQTFPDIVVPVYRIIPAGNLVPEVGVTYKTPVPCIEILLRVHHGKRSRKPRKKLLMASYTINGSESGVSLFCISSKTRLPTWLDESCKKVYSYNGR